MMKREIEKNVVVSISSPVAGYQQSLVEQQ